MGRTVFGSSLFSLLALLFCLPFTVAAEDEKAVLVKYLIALDFNTLIRTVDQITTETQKTLGGTGDGTCINICVPQPGNTIETTGRCYSCSDSERLRRGAALDTSERWVVAVSGTANRNENSFSENLEEAVRPVVTNAGGQLHSITVLSVNTQPDSPEEAPEEIDEPPREDEVPNDAPNDVPKDAPKDGSEETPKEAPKEVSGEAPKEEPQTPSAEKVVLVKYSMSFEFDSLVKATPDITSKTQETLGGSGDGKCVNFCTQTGDNMESIGECFSCSGVKQQRQLSAQALGKWVVTVSGTAPVDKDDFSSDLLLVIRALIHPLGGELHAVVATTANIDEPAVSTDSDDSLSGGAIAGIVIGCVVGVIVILLLVYCLACKSDSEYHNNEMAVYPKALPDTTV
eukprot:TRINITY_DN2663_c0_g2_i1.p1 TRINITY_DN2663_c0_g2~~TRINITY_DN2663_c0_g2_i1.p1  ORF type:complete len:400 (+),score=108.56 TRINITY_DN2663_c0_g2_i1:47-1246(+)